jgi:hypothetical protein
MDGKDSLNVGAGIEESAPVRSRSSRNPVNLVGGPRMSRGSRERQIFMTRVSDLDGIHGAVTSNGLRPTSTPGAYRPFFLRSSYIARRSFVPPIVYKGFGIDATD